MLDVKLTKQRFIDHFYYSKWLYVLFILTAVIIFSFVYAVTRPVVPEEFRVDINVLGISLQDSEMNLWEEEILSTLSQDQQEVNIIAMGVTASGDESVDYTSYEVLVTRVAAKEGDIYILPKSMYLGLAQQGAFLPLDDIVSNYKFPQDIDIEEYNILIEDEDYSDGVAHIFGLPLDNVKGLIDLGFDPTDKVIMVMVYTNNYDNAIKAIDYIMNKTESVLQDGYEAVDEK